MSAGTRADYRRHGEKRLKPFFGQVRLSAMNVQTVKDFVADQVEQVEGGSTGPQDGEQRAHVLEHMHEGGSVTREDPVEPMRPRLAFARANVERDWLRRQEFLVYVDACSEVYRPLAEVLIATVMRISESLALRWDDVDFANRVIRVYRQRTAAGEDGHTKSRRFAPFPWAIAC